MSAAQALIDLFRTAGRVRFAPVEYELAREGVLVMDRQAELADRPTAIAAADCSEARLAEVFGEAVTQ